MSFKNILNGRRPRIEPWGTPVIISVELLNELFTELFCCALDKQFYNRKYVALQIAGQNLLYQKPLRFPLVLPLFFLLYQNVFSGFYHFQERVLSVTVFSEATQVRRKFFSHRIISLFIKDPLKDFCIVWQYADVFIIFFFKTTFSLEYKPYIIQFKINRENSLFNTVIYHIC